MTGILSPKAARELVKNHYTGHLAVADENGPYVVPFTYYYDEASNSLISYTAEGRKVDALRKDARACVNVSEIKALNLWKSVIVEGTFEELKEVEAVDAILLLITRLKDQVNASGHPEVDTIAEMSPAKASATKVVYRINIDKISGRFETQETAEKVGA
ncbi:MAG: pyridoxamine 5'-phosphate oxidase family protein [Bacteroidota bacterium]